MEKEGEVIVAEVYTVDCNALFVHVYLCYDYNQCDNCSMHLHDCAYIMQVVVYQNPSKLDLDSSELSIGAIVQRLQVTVLFRFLNRVKVGFASGLYPFTHHPSLPLHLFQFYRSLPWGFSQICN